MTTAALNWDQWRADYPTLTYEDQVAYHSAIYERYPDQNHHSTQHVAQAIDEVQPTTVVELGGWDGALAHEMLDRHPSIRRWTNYEICHEAAKRGNSWDRWPRYMAPDPGCFYWEKDHRCDLFVASHVIEHLTSDHLAATIDATNTKAMFFDAPLGQHPYGWHGFTGTHILDIGWTGIDHLMHQAGYRLHWRHNHPTPPESGGWSIANLYTKTGAMSA